jgi:hypothetical protein
MQTTAGLSGFGSGAGIGGSGAGIGGISPSGGIGGIGGTNTSRSNIVGGTSSTARSFGSVQKVSLNKQGNPFRGV